MPMSQVHVSWVGAHVNSVLTEMVRDSYTFFKDSLKVLKFTYHDAKNDKIITLPRVLLH